MGARHDVGLERDESETRAAMRQIFSTRLKYHDSARQMTIFHVLHARSSSAPGTPPKQKYFLAKSLDCEAVRQA